MDSYGKEIILDIHDCNPEMFTREKITIFFDTLCEKIDMQQEDLHFWDYLDCAEEKVEAPPHLQGTSAIQFIQTSNITIHTLDILKKVYLNIFSCKDFSDKIVKEYSAEYFQGNIISCNTIERI